MKRDRGRGLQKKRWKYWLGPPKRRATGESDLVEGPHWGSGDVEEFHSALPFVSWSQKDRMPHARLLCKRRVMHGVVAAKNGRASHCRHDGSPRACGIHAPPLANSSAQCGRRPASGERPDAQLAASPRRSAAEAEPSQLWTFLSQHQPRRGRPLLTQIDGTR